MESHIRVKFYSFCILNMLSVLWNFLTRTVNSILGVLSFDEMAKSIDVALSQLEDDSIQIPLTEESQISLTEEIPLKDVGNGSPNTENNELEHARSCGLGDIDEVHEDDTVIEENELDESIDEHPLVSTTNPLVEEQTQDKKKRRRKRGKKHPKNKVEEGTKEDSSEHPSSPKKESEEKELRKRNNQKSAQNRRADTQLSSSNAGKMQPSDGNPNRRFSHSALKLSDEIPTSSIRPIRQPFGPLLGTNGFSAEYQKSRFYGIQR